MTPASGVDRLTYRADLDGLRAVAVLLVITSHAAVPMENNGGDVGVTAFFVLSGYLITRLLLEERATTGGVRLRAFYRRRAIRLGPALLAVIGFVAVVGVALRLPSEWPLGIVTCLVYVSNWALVLGHQIDPLGHTWSLAIEEQFYLVWPAVLVLVGPRRAVWLAIGGVVLGTVVRTITTGDFEYFSTVTRGDAILLGCLLALFAVRLPWWTSPLGIVGLIVLAYLNLSHDISIPLAMFGAVLVVASDWPPLGVLAAIGRRSYALYLWNWPMALLFGGGGVVLTFLAAEVSFHLIERPIARRWRTVRAERGTSR